MPTNPHPSHFGQVTNPFVFGSHVWHFPMTTQHKLRSSPVPLHSGHRIYPLLLQRGHVDVMPSYEPAVVPWLVSLLLTMFEDYEVSRSDWEVIVL